MLFLRPFLVSIIDRKYISASIYSALHFYPCLLVLHALCAGLICKRMNLKSKLSSSSFSIDFSFPILTILSAVLLNTIHFTIIANGEQQWLVFLRKLAGNIQNWIIYFLHVIILLCGLISLTDFQNNSYVIILSLVFVPGLLYIFLYKFTATSTIRTTIS